MLRIDREKRIKKLEVLAFSLQYLLAIIPHQKKENRQRFQKDIYYHIFLKRFGLNTIFPFYKPKLLIPLFQQGIGHAPYASEYNQKQHPTGTHNDLQKRPYIYKNQLLHHILLHRFPQYFLIFLLFLDHLKSKSNKIIT